MNHEQELKNLRRDFVSAFAQCLVETDSATCEKLHKQMDAAARRINEIEGEGHHARRAL